MNILIINGSPKGNNSGTLYTSLYLEKLHPEHTFRYLPVGQRIKYYESDFSQPKEELEWAELIVFSYPVYTFIAPYQIHRFVELMKESDIDLSGKWATQITTSKHFYDVTAHKYVEANCADMGMRYVPGLSADMEDLLHEKGQLEARSFFDQTTFFIANGSDGIPLLQNTSVKGAKKITIVTSCSEEDEALKDMIQRFVESSNAKVKICNIRQFPFKGGCLGCLQCAVTGKCIYTDGFDDYLRNEIQDCDGMVYAFTVENHYAHSSMKAYDDRQFCNGHRTVMEGTPVGYLINGNYSQEANLQMIVEARASVGGNFFAGVVANEDGKTKEMVNLEIKNLALVMDNALAAKWVRPKDFYGVGGGKIFRDLIYVMRGIMKADHLFYKSHGAYDDLPQKQKGKMLGLMLAGKMLSMPSVQKKMGGKMTEFMVAPYKKVIDSVSVSEKKCNKNGGDLNV